MNKRPFEWFTLKWVVIRTLLYYVLIGAVMTLVAACVVGVLFSFLLGWLGFVLGFFFVIGAVLYGLASSWAFKDWLLWVILPGSTATLLTARDTLRRFNDEVLDSIAREDAEIANIMANGTSIMQAPYRLFPTDREARNKWLKQLAESQRLRGELELIHGVISVRAMTDIEHTDEGLESLNRRGLGRRHDAIAPKHPLAVTIIYCAADTTYQQVLNAALPIVQQMRIANWFMDRNNAGFSAVTELEIKPGLPTKHYELLKPYQHPAIPTV